MTTDQPSNPSAEDLMLSASEETPLVEEEAPLVGGNLTSEGTDSVAIEDLAESEEETELAETAELVEPAKSTSEQLIYIGDPIRRNGVALRTDQVFIGGLPTYLNELYEEYPIIKTLFVPVSSMFEAKKEIQTVGTPLYMANCSLKGD